MPSAKKLKKTSTLKKQPAWTERILKGWRPYLLFVLLGFMLYGRTLTYDYTYLDDHTLILQRIDELKTFTGLHKIFDEDAFHSTGKGFYYRPLLTFSFMLDARLGDGWFGMFHLTNIILHLLAVSFIFILLGLLGCRREAAFILSLVFLVHPLALQAVAWVPGRNDSLLAVFVLAAFVFFLRYLREQKATDQVLHILFFLLALFTKETAIALPVIALFYLFITKQLKTGSLAIYLVVWIGAVFSWLVVRYNALGGSSGFSMEDSLVSLGINLPAILPYLGKFLFPFYLSVLPVFSDLVFHLFAGIVVLGLLVYICIRGRNKRVLMYVFGLLWFLIFLLPSFIQQLGKPANFSDHRVYLSMIGLLILVAEADVLKNLKWRLAAVAFIVFLVIINVVYSDTFSNRLAFWNNAVRTSPGSAFNANNLGAMFYLEKDLANAENYFRMAVRVNPKEPMANGNLGLVLMNTNRFEEAEKFYLEEIKVNPAYDHVYFNLGVLYYRSGLKTESFPLFEQTIKINPVYADAYRFLVNGYLEKGDTIQAAHWLRLATEKSINVYE